MHKVHSSSVKLQVYRGSGSTYTLVGENSITATTTGTQYVYNVPSSSQITVQAGDYIGLRFSSPATIPFTGGGDVRWGSGPGHADIAGGSSYTFPGSGGRQDAVTATLCAITTAPTSVPTPTPTEVPTTKPPSPSPSHTPTENPTRTPTHQPTPAPTQQPSATAVNCHCTNCKNHYRHNEHIKSSPDLCGSTCQEESQCAFSLYDAATTKCYYYNLQQLASIMYTRRAESSQFTCYHKLVS